MNARREVFSPAADEQDRRTPSPVPSFPRRPSTAPGLVGRDRELRELQGFLRTAVAHGGPCVIRGDAGSGKSELLETAVGLATAAGLHVLRCTGVRGGNPPEYSGLLQIVWPVLKGLRWSLEARQCQLLERLLVDGVPTHGDRGRLSFAVLGALESAGARQPLLIAVDDWDALDEPSREVLSFVARRPGGQAPALLMTSRPHRAHLASLAGLTELDLAPLTPAQSAALLAAERPDHDPQGAHELLATAAGNPLVLLELPVRTEDPVPYAPASSDRLAAALAPGVAQLPPATRDLLLVAALHPAGDLPLLLSAASRITGAAAGFAVVEPAERDGLVTFDGTRLRFSHPATAGAVVHDLAPHRLRAAHAALAAALEQDPVQKLWHLSQAAEEADPELAGRLEAVHRHALHRSEPVIGVRLLRRAADLHHAPEDRGRCALLAAQLAHDLGWEGLARTTAQYALRHPLGPLGTLCAEALTRLGDEDRDDEDPRRAPADPAAWPVPVGADERTNALELAQLTAPEVAGDEARVDALLAFLDGLPEHADDPRLLHTMAAVGPVRRAAAVIARLSALPRLAHLSQRDVERLAEAALLAGDPLRALDLYRRTEHRYRFRELTDQLPRVVLRQGMAHLITGDWAQAELSFRRCGELAEENFHGHHASAARLLGNVVRGLRTGTVPAVAARDLTPARRSVRSIDEIVAVGTAWAQVESGDFAAGFAALSSLLADPGRCAAARYALVPFAEAADAVNAAEEARATLAGLERELGAEHTPLVSVGLTVARAVLADDAGAECRYARAFALDLSHRPFLEASLRLAHGRLLRRRHEFTESRVTLRQAAATFTTMGAEARVARITAELRASGERAEPAAPGASPSARPEDLLSPQELRIAQLAGRGLSNRQIGAELNLSPRTIGSYLYRIFPLLGVTARVQLAEALRDVPGT
ncbi:AAA family ATPase [Streptomyces sp. NPDC002514]|uniref:helix-turn-helix transcriptional regulator n=1 Tax=Streptomyces sp. NPDC001270 TaxID=3364554 RepID=UPI0036988E0B